MSPLKDRDTPRVDRYGALRGLLPSVAIAWCCPVALLAQADPFLSLRQDLIQREVVGRGITQPKLLSAMEEVPRHAFVPEVNRRDAYGKDPVAIAPGRTLSQAYISALMISLLQLEGDERVLEVGTGSGYDAALLSRVAGEVFTIEIDPRVAAEAEKRLRRLGYENVHVRVGDGYHGWPEEGPFDAILLTAAPERIPEPLLDQLRVAGRLVVAVGGLVQDLQVITKTDDGAEVRRVSPVVLGPMTGEVRRRQN